jgi:hypothetical protein
MFHECVFTLILRSILVVPKLPYEQSWIFHEYIFMLPTQLLYYTFKTEHKLACCCWFKKQWIFSYNFLPPLLSSRHMHLLSCTVQQPSWITNTGLFLHQGGEEQCLLYAWNENAMAVVSNNKNEIQQGQQKAKKQ